MIDEKRLDEMESHIKESGGSIWGAATSEEERELLRLARLGLVYESNTKPLNDALNSKLNQIQSALEKLLTISQKPQRSFQSAHQQERTPAERLAFEIITRGGMLNHGPDTERKIAELAPTLEKYL